ncbi:MAG: hypothetical protein DMG96_30085 [Acidobacteria bacterium]|nr:MAG: hypothetical protein DMG96_30085 [Acidobacteriota bacterium]
MTPRSNPTRTMPRAEERHAPAEVEAEIRRRAYELYERRGRVGGHDLDDWLQAEAEVLERKFEAAGA